MNPAKFRHRIDVYSNVKSTNELGELTYSFGRVKAVWAQIIPQTGNLQKQETETLLTNVTHKIIVRYNSGKDITKDMQIKFGDRLFEIKYILNPYFKNETLEIFVTEVME